MNRPSHWPQGSGFEPTVGGERPPPRLRGRARGRAGAGAGAATMPGRVVAVFGPQRAGVTTLCRVACSAARTPCRLVEDGLLWDDVERAVLAARSDGAEVVFVDGYPRDVHDVQWLYNKRFVAPGWGGLLVRVRREAVLDHAFEASLPALETRIQLLGQPYFVVRADDAVQGAVDLLVRSGVGR